MQYGLVCVFQKLLIYWDYQAQRSLAFTENGPEKGTYTASSTCEDSQRRTDRLVQDDRKVTVTHKATV